MRVLGLDPYPLGALPTSRILPRTSSTQAQAILSLFLTAQVCDGALTYIGVRTFGLNIEGNPIVAWYMAVVGIGVGVILMKGLAAVCALILHWQAYHLTLGLLTVLYVGAALWPWLRLLAL